MYARIINPSVVCRKEDPNDRRNKLVFLTPAGEEFKEQIRPVFRLGLCICRTHYRY